MDTETTLLFVTCFGITAALCMLAVLMEWLQRRRIPPVAGGWALACAAVVMICLMTAQPRYGVLRRASESGSPRRAPKPQRPEPPPVEDRGFWWMPDRPRDDTGGRRAAEQARVDELNRWIAPAVEQYRSEHGVYPPTLEAAGIRTPMTRYGPLYYYSSGTRSDAWYLLSFGDIERHRFSADWDSRTKRWTVTSLSF